MTASFLFYDLETFGTDPRRSRIAQFAAIRTNEALDEVEEPISFFVKPADDLLPAPVATLITGIAPQDALRDGMNEAAAFARINDEMARPGTCSAGYNSLRFDDEFVRHGLYRDFYDPYEREWRGGNSRWDLLDALRLMHALRPEGIAWRAREDGGGTSFKLEHLAEDNGLRVGDAHEALSDVRATIGLARLFRKAQPRLWDYALKLRDKRFAASLLDPVAMAPLLHVSQRYPASRMSAAPVVPLARHPRIDGRMIVFDLASDPGALLELDAETIAARMYLRRDQLGEGEERIALKEVHFNKCPALVAWDHLRPADFERLGIDPAEAETRAARLRAAGPALAEKLRNVYTVEAERGPADADGALYDGFIDDADRRLFPQVRSMPPEALGLAQFAFRDPRLPELLFRYRARNWPAMLSAAERERWDGYRRERLLTDSGLSESTLPAFFSEIETLRGEHAGDDAKLALLGRLEAWGREIEGSLR
ncbi:exodeoxyribonuclease I [Pseudoluteimonas lycopersici]|uniref:Exodeoxyribonuclease I n=1 Tax=Pseudoluteimonas lycopersici TaxID=1324796 RepID=A0A516V2U8_9GAMM|nr:exodeoxyribonuclease I [Lysobacter lycopersici]QDQ72827.1 exodeoxyribonuclease I [Lysobacter lycopersici]